MSFITTELAFDNEAAAVDFLRQAGAALTPDGAFMTAKGSNIALFKPKVTQAEIGAGTMQ